MSEDVTLPTTVEEYQQARREAFLNGAAYAKGWSMGDEPLGESEARRRYPIRKKVPRLLSDATGAEWKCVPGGSGEPRLFVRLPGSTRWEYPTNWEPDAAHVELWSELLANPYDEVDE